MKKILLAIALLGAASWAPAQGTVPQTKFSVWFPYQLIPSLTLYSSSPNSAFGFEWELTPLLYSFGMNKQISPWYSFIVNPAARFTGSIEINIAGEFFTSKLGHSYFASSGQMMGFIPLAGHGEDLTLNLGAGVYRVAEQTRVFKVVGVSTLFGIVHFNLKHSPNPTTWIGSLEFRIF